MFIPPLLTRSGTLIDVPHAGSNQAITKSAEIFQQRLEGLEVIRKSHIKMWPFRR